MTRQLWDIYADMLKAALKPIRKTRILLVITEVEKKVYEET